MVCSRALLGPLALVLAVYLPACTPHLPAKIPMPTLSYPANDAPGKALLIFLPGIRDRASDFASHGFIAQLDKQSAQVDAIAADAHINYYVQGSFRERLEADVVRPALEEGYRDIWLVGVSLGGFGALRYARSHPDQIAGVIALAPYLGERDRIEAMAEEGRYPLNADSDSSRQRAVAGLWEWLQARGDQNTGGPVVYLGYGQRDKFARACSLMAQNLPRDHVITLPGGHNWSTWKRLWGRFLKEGKLAFGALS